VGNPGFRQHWHVAIYLDASILRAWRSFTDASCLAVGIVAHQLGQQIFVPAIAAREAEEGYRRALTEALEDFWRGHWQLESCFEGEFPLDLDPWPDIDQRVELWRRRLEEFATVMPLEGSDAHEALEREITGRRPAQPRERKKPGRGGRDAAIWLSVVRHHAGAGEEGHFLARDPKAFSDGYGKLHPDLATELGGENSLKLYESIVSFVEKLGSTAVPHELALETLAEHASEALKQAIEAGSEADHAMWDGLNPDFRFKTRVDGLIPTAVSAQRRYELGEDAIVLVKSQWELQIACGFQERNTDQPSLWSMIEKLDASAQVQLFLEEREGRFHSAQILTVEITSKTGLSLEDNGTVSMWTLLP
jgi:hypothetical protein